MSTTTTATTTSVARPPAPPPTMSQTNVSPKVSKTSKPLPVPLPTYHGCNHMAAMLSREPAMVKGYYAGATRVVLDSTDRTIAQWCTACKGFVLSKIYLCLQCAEACCAPDFAVHAEQTGHTFGVDSRSANVFCFECDDYTYDPELEKIRIECEVANTGGPRKRRRLENADPSSEELRYIESNTGRPGCGVTGLRGFLNMGQTCFMSVVMQSLIHNPLIRNHFLGDGHRARDCQNKDCMNCAVEQVIHEFFTSDKVDGFVPMELLSTSWACGNPEQMGYKQQDAHEYLHFLLDQLHVTSTGNDGNDSGGPCQCIVHRSFYGKLQCDVVCSNCGNVTPTVEPLKDLSLGLRLKDRRKDSTSPQTLQDCLDRYTSKERLTNYECTHCKSPQSATTQSTIKRLPPILSIQLKRFESQGGQSQKIEDRIGFPMTLDMTPYTTKAKNSGKASSGKFKYDLFGVIVHKGNVDSGHYINYARENGQWFQFDDSVVTLASEKQVLAAQAYMLTYSIRSFG